MKKLDSCLMCQGVGARYKFRCCHRSFCSKECFSQHSECDSRLPERLFVPERRFVRHNNFDLDLVEEDLISEDVLEKVSASSEISALLSDPLLQRILTRLDMSKNRRESFSKLYESSPIFVQLLELISSVAGLQNGDSSIIEQ